MSAGSYVGIDLGGTNMQIGVVSDGLELLGRAKRKTKAHEGPSGVLERLVHAVEEACDESGVSLDRVAGVGIGAPGVIDAKTGTVIEAVNLRWNDMPLADELSKRLGRPVVVDNDVNVALWGEYRAGASKGVEHQAGVWIGTGIGGALILNGRLFYGHFNSAGEVGHTVLMPNNPPGVRSLEHNCSRTVIVDRLRRLIAANEPSKLHDLTDGDLDKIKSKVIADAYEQEDWLTRHVVDDAAYRLGVAVANLVTLLSVERVVLGGGLVEALGESLVSKIRDAAGEHIFPVKCKQVGIVASALEDDAGVIGAAALASEKLADA